MQLPRSLHALRRPGYARIWLGAFISNIGTWMETVGVGILVTEQTGKAGWTGTVAAAAFLPLALVGTFGGALADRFSRRRLVIGGTSVQMTLAGVLTTLAALDQAKPLIVTIIVFLSGCAGALVMPTYQAIIPDLVPPEELSSAVTLNAAQYNLGRVIGPAIAGIVIALGGYQWAFAINTLSFVAVIVSIWPLALSQPPRPTGSIRSSIMEAFRFDLADPGLRAITGYLAVLTFFAAPFIALVPAVAIKVFHHKEGGTSLLVTAQGLGAVVMAVLLAGLVYRLGTRGVLIAASGVVPMALVAYAAAPTIGLAAVAIFFVGGVYLGALSTMSMIVQYRAPARLRGRLMSINMIFMGSLYPLGSIIQGAIADKIGLRVTTMSAAALIAIAAVTIRVVHPGFDRHIADRFAEDAPGGGVPTSHLWRRLTGPHDVGPARVATTPIVPVGAGADT